MDLSERDGEFAQLMNLFAGCVAGRGGVAVVSGPVACGRTQLLHAFTEQVADEAVILSATGAPSERTLPAGVLTQLFHGAPLPFGHLDAVVRLLDEAASNALLADPGSDATQQLQAQVMNGLCRYLLELAGNAPLVITIDDVQYADIPSLQFLLFLLRRTRTERVLVVLTESEHSQWFPSVLHSDLLRQPHCHRIRLDPLSADGVARQLVEHFDCATAGRIAVRCHAVSGGNPLLVGALIEDLRAAQRQDQDISSGTSAPPDDVVAGSEYAYAVLSCLHRSEPVALPVARGLAVLGEETSNEAVGQLVGTDADTVVRTVRTLESSGLLADGYFRHPAARAAVLNEITAPERSRLYRDAARMLHNDGAAPTAVAEHLIAAGHTDAPWVLRVLLDAAEQALLGDDVDLAIKALELALLACDCREDRALVTVLLAEAEWRVDPLIAARHRITLVEVLREGLVPDYHADWLIRYLLWNGYVEDAVRALERLSRYPLVNAADAADPAHPADPQAQADTMSGEPTGDANRRLTQLWQLHLRPAFLERMRPSSPSPVQRGITATPVGPQLQGASALSVVLTHGPSGGEAVRAAEAVLQNIHLTDPALACIVPALLALIYSDEPDTAETWCDRLLQDATDRRAPTWQAELANIRSEIAFRKGDLAAAAAFAEAALTHISGRSWGAAVGAPLAGSILALTAMGRFEEAAKQLRHPIPETAFQTVFGLRYLYARADYHLATGLLHASLDDFLACGHLMREWGIDLPGFIPWRTGAAAACLGLGRKEYARQLVDEQLGRPGADRSRTYGLSLHQQAVLADVRERPALLRKAIDTFQECGDRYGQALALADLSDAQRVLGEYARWRMTARMATQVAQECGAEPVAARTLMSSSTKEKEPPWQEAESPGEDDSLLSEAEQRVAALATLGHTNREIAGKLCVTMSTVEQHLTRIYRKLNVNSRADLPSALRSRRRAGGGDPADEPGVGVVDGEGREVSWHAGRPAKVAVNL